MFQTQFLAPSAFIKYKLKIKVFTVNSSKNGAIIIIIKGLYKYTSVHLTSASFSLFIN